MDVHNLKDFPCIWLVWCLLVSQVNAKCTELPSVEHSTNNVTDEGPFPTGTVVEVRCKIGYRPYGNLYFTCVGKRFIGQLECNIILCPAIDPPKYGYIANEPLYEAGTSITFECIEGYVMTGQGTLNCRVDGYWSPDYVPKCTARNCGEFGLIVDGTTFQESTTDKPNDYGSVVRVNCNPGYTLNGDKYVRCKADGTWGIRPVCVKVVCPPYPGSDSSCVQQQMLVGDTLYMICKEDVSVTQVGDFSVTCRNGQWSFLDMACYCDCEITVDHASMKVLSNIVTFIEKQYVKHDTELDWECNQGFVKNSHENIRCQDGNITQPVCIRQVTPKPEIDIVNRTTPAFNETDITKSNTSAVKETDVTKFNASAVNETDVTKPNKSDESETDLTKPNKSGVNETDVTKSNTSETRKKSKQGGHHHHTHRNHHYSHHHHHHHDHHNRQYHRYGHHHYHCHLYYHHHHHYHLCHNHYHHHRYYHHHRRQSHYHHSHPHHHNHHHHHQSHSSHHHHHHHDRYHRHGK